MLQSDHLADRSCFLINGAGYGSNFNKIFIHLENDLTVKLHENTSMCFVDYVVVLCLYYFRIVSK